MVGKTGDQGPPGPVSGGVVYTRWGKRTCPSISGTSMLYSGIAGGTHHTHGGGGGNYLCMPEDPEYILPSRSGVQGHAYVHGGVYGDPIQGDQLHKIPCAVCEVSTRVMKLMIPAKATCPSSWTLEYRGYIMTMYTMYGKLVGDGRGTFECVDEDQESLPGSETPDDFIFGLTHVEAGCGTLPCPLYNSTKELNCVICTK